MSYNRVIPRDLFNEAKLLKCLGQLSLLIHDGKDIRWPLRMEHRLESGGFYIDLDGARGGITCLNLTVWNAGRSMYLYSPCNAKSPYPLQFVRDDCSEGDVFNDDGTLSAEFAEWLDNC